MKHPKTTGRFLRWTMFWLVIFYILLNVRVKVELELNKSNFIDEAIEKVNWMNKVVKFVRSF